MNIDMQGSFYQELSFQVEVVKRAIEARNPVFDVIYESETGKKIDNTGFRVMSDREEMQKYFAAKLTPLRATIKSLDREFVDSLREETTKWGDNELNALKGAVDMEYIQKYFGEVDVHQACRQICFIRRGCFSLYDRVISGRWLPEK